MSDIIDKLHNLVEDLEDGSEGQIACVEAANRIATLEKLDREAAQYVETVIVMRTPFEGDPPYVGWKGLGLALTEALDKRDALEQENKRLREAMTLAECQYMSLGGGASPEWAVNSMRDILNAALEGGKQ